MVQQLIDHAREEGNLDVTVVAETVMLRLTAPQRANELNSEYRDQWVKVHPNEPLAEEINLASADGPVRSTEMQALPLTLYFARASIEGSHYIAVGGRNVLTSEIGTPESDAIYNVATTRYRDVLKASEDPAQAFLEAIDLFLNAAAARRAELYRDDKPSSNSGFSAIILIGLGLLFAALLVIGLRKLGGQGREEIFEATLPKLPLKTRLGGRHSGGMTANISWAQPSKKKPSDDATQ